MGSSWTENENNALTKAYIDMLEKLMNGGDVVKAEVRRELIEGPLAERSDSSVEFKMANASAALDDAGYPWVEGYKPLENYQQQLQDIAKIMADERQLLEKSIRWAVEQFGRGVAEAGLTFDEELIRTFVCSLATKRFVILTGLSGSGKTQIAKQFGHWLGEEHFEIVPVRPDWTGSEALFGYQDALMPPADDGRRGWTVPRPLEFMLRASRDPDNPYLLILDEMNLAHVERYFADALSGMESDHRVLPNLQREDDGIWRIRKDAEYDRICLPDNLFIVGTVNVDETTYMFSPKVLDRANTIEFRVRTEDLADEYRRPSTCTEGPRELVRGFLSVARSANWHTERESNTADVIDTHLRSLHSLLSEAGFEFGHRVFFEVLRFSALYEAAGNSAPMAALDRQVMQKLLPRLHGSRRRLETTLCGLAHFCHDLTFDEGSIIDGKAKSFDPMEPRDEAAALPVSFDKLRRMTRNLRANQFVSFTE